MPLVELQHSQVRFRRYPYSAASVYPNGSVDTDSIREVIPSAAPPEIRTVKGEVLFVPAAEETEFEQWAIDVGVPVVERVDVWGLILEPFVDTEFTEERSEHVFSLLEKEGIARHFCWGIRQSVREMMYAYNILSGLWDWCHLGLSDLLNAFLGRVCGYRFRLTAKEFHVAYWEAMRIAESGRLLSVAVPDGMTLPPKTEPPELSWSHEPTPASLFTRLLGLAADIRYLLDIAPEYLRHRRGGN